MRSQGDVILLLNTEELPKGWESKVLNSEKLRETNKGSTSTKPVNGRAREKKGSRHATKPLMKKTLGDVFFVAMEEQRVGWCQGGEDFQRQGTGESLQQAREGDRS